jgi:hypothetical protein
VGPATLYCKIDKQTPAAPALRADRAHGPRGAAERYGASDAVHLLVLSNKSNALKTMHGAHDTVEQ